MAGRPRNFNLDETLQKIMLVFWESGYFDTSMHDLCAATDLTKPSIYRAFGNKEDVFLQALEHYLKHYIRPSLEKFQSMEDTDQALETLIIESVNSLTDENTPAGCMIMSNLPAAAAPDLPPRIQDALIKAAQETPTAIQKRLSSSQSQVHTDNEKQAQKLFWEMIISGLSSLARRGVKRAELLKLVQQTLKQYQPSM